ncbi:sensor histidine kinase [Mucilaginibacter conchicola]|uniref:histidine kinase n=1 Tax=Mucilaginibacter conchicola TaxID=2303333 RepID=A0A372NVG4_9SPHI|nr:ATP-binding protein [Mucilaginibacter conchicola]RFZ92597.1 sensor histidine kinase [Mucilaginibacter conchicola]
MRKDEELIVLIVAGTIMLLLLGIFIISFLFFYQKRHNQNTKDKEQLQATFEQELLKAQNEIQEQTLSHISSEIHDNITQVLSFVKLNLAASSKNSSPEAREKINESRTLVAQVINDLRDLSKSLSFEHIKQIGLVKTIELEAERLNRSEIIEIDLSIGGDAHSLGEQRELVLFRIFQETLNNALKHAQATQLKIRLDYFEHLFNLTIQDNGVGFSAGTLPNSGSGLRNIVNRAALIGADAVIDSAPNRGCTIKITIDPLTKQPNADGN